MARRNVCSEPVLHRLRLFFKRLRYVQEFLESFRGAEGKRRYLTAGGFQETLGELHDYAVLRNDIAAKMPKVRKTADRRELRVLKQLRTSAGEEMDQLYRRFIKGWNHR